MHHYAIAASIAGGTGGPGNFEQNRKIARSMRETVIAAWWGRSAIIRTGRRRFPIRISSQDPSLGMPHLFYQIAQKGSLALVAPEPYNTERFIAPSWFSR